MPKYTDRQDSQNIIEYTNFSKPSIKLTNGQVIGGNYKYNNNDTEFTPGSPIINAIDINWGSAILQYLSTGTTSIYTTSDLLKYIQNLNKNIVQNKVTGIKINDTIHPFENGIIEINDIVSNIIITASSIDSTIRLEPDENGVIDISPLISPINNKLNQVASTVDSHTVEISLLKDSMASAIVDPQYIIDIVSTSLPPIDWNAPAGSPGSIINKPADIDIDILKNTLLEDLTNTLNGVLPTSIPPVIISELDNTTGTVYTKLIEIIDNQQTDVVDGKDGKSAYQIAVDEYYNSHGVSPDWTEATWLETLKGEKGDKGDPGNAISIKTEQTCENPGDSYIYTNSEGKTYLIIHQGEDNEGEIIWGTCDLNIVITPGSPPRVDNNGYWEWWDSLQNRYVSTIPVENGEPIRIQAQGEQGPAGLDIYNLASSIYHTNENIQPRENTFLSFNDWYANKVVPHINSEGYWVIDTNPATPGKSSIEVLKYLDTNNNYVQAKAIGEKGNPGKSPKIVATTLEGESKESNIWYVYDDTTNNYVPAETEPGKYIIAEGISGKDGRDLKLNLIPYNKLIEEGYVEIVGNEYQFTDKVTHATTDGYFAVNITATPDPIEYANFFGYASPGVYYIYDDTNGYRWEYVTPIQGADGAPGKTAYEIAINTALDEFNSNNPGQAINDWQEAIKHPENIPEELQYLLSESTWIDSLRATTISNDVKDQIINDIKSDLDYIASVTINNKPGTIDSSYTANININGEDIQISSTNASTLSEFVEDVETQLTNTTPKDGTFTVEINTTAASNIVFSANTDGLVTLNLPDVINENITNNTEISGIKSNIASLATAVGSINQAIGFTPEDFDTITTLKNVIEELQNPETGTMDSVLDDIVNGIGNKVEKIDLIIPSSDFTTPATLSININNPTANLSDKIVTGISVNGNTLSPATGLVTIGSVVTNIKYTTKDGNNEDQIISITNTDGNISLDDFATTISNNIKDEIESISDNKYVATTDDYVKSIKVYTGATATADIVAATGNVVLNLNDYAKMMKLIIKNYTSKTTDAQDNIVYTTGTATLDIGSTDVDLDLSAYATKEDIDIINATVEILHATLAENYYNKTQIDNSMKWKVISDNNN